MKTFISLFIIAFFVSLNVNAQIKINLKDKLEKNVNTRLNSKTDKAIDKGLDETEEGVKDSFSKDNDDTSDSEDSSSSANKKDEISSSNPKDESITSQDSKSEETAPTLIWSKYDFVPGDKVIFEDNLIGEENGEFPSRWDLVNGTIENAVFGEENVIMFRGGDPTIIPYIKNMNMDYLPDIFTIEFDLYLPYNTLTVHFYDKKNQSAPSGRSSLNIMSQKMDFYPASSILPDEASINKRWAHISIAYTNGKMKAYIDETRLINIPHLAFNPTGVSIEAYHANDNNRFYIKNIRIAEGGVKYYDRVLQDGKIIANGIRFDVGKATLKPESMGIINEIYDLMNEHSDLKFSIEGHTDSDGNDDTNQKLSEDRAKTVMNTLIKMGISNDRLSSKGLGESKPIDTNGTAEGKANNRRVEFLKM